MNANSNQYGSRAAPVSNASGITGEAAALTEQSNGTFPFGNSQNVDQSTGYDNASQWQWSYRDTDQPFGDTGSIWNSENPDKIIFNDKDGELTDESIAACKKF